MPNKPHNHGLRRYDSGDHFGLLVDTLTGNVKNPQEEINRMENLEALYYRGFWFDYRRQLYTNGQIEVSPESLSREKLYDYIDRKMRGK